MDYNKYIGSTGTHYISNSGSDEKGKLHGGAAGDQTGKEWQLRKWYDRPWSCVLRWMDQAVALKIAELGIAAALNSKIGYDQYQRTTYWKQLEAAGYDPAKIATACETDCTAGVAANCKAVGYIMGIPALKALSVDTYSGNLRSRFKAAGFTVLTASKYRTSPKYLLPGDILLYEGHHAATNITIGSAVRGAWKPEVVPVQYDGTPKLLITGASVNVRPAPNKDRKPLGVVHKGDYLDYQGQDADNGWHLVVYKGANAWVSPKLSEIRTVRVVVTGANVYVRSGPSTTEKEYGTVHKGDSFSYTGQSKNGWYQILYGTKTAWISGKLSKLEG